MRIGNGIGVPQWRAVSGWGMSFWNWPTLAVLPNDWSRWFDHLLRFCLSLVKPLLINSALAFIALAIATSQGLYHRGNF